MLKIKFFSLILCNILLTYGQLDYCNMGSICDNLPHVKCNNDGGKHTRCPAEAHLLQLSDNDKDHIVEVHNIKRNTVAAGQIPGYEPAQRMGEMRWSPELAEMAELFLKQCDIYLNQSANCYRLPKYPSSTQNYYYWKGNMVPKNPIDQIFVAINLWFGQYKDRNMSIISDPTFNRNPGHFTRMVCEDNTQVACAQMLYPLPHPHGMVYVACYYGGGHAVGRPVYVAGKSTSGCRSGPSPKYKELCSICERYYY